MLLRPQTSSVKAEGVSRGETHVHAESVLLWEEETGLARDYTARILIQSVGKSLGFIVFLENLRPALRNVGNLRIRQMMLRGTKNLDYC